MERQERREQILNILAAGIRKVLLNTVPKPEELQEIRMRLGQPLRVVRGKEEIVLRSGTEPYIVTKEELRETMDYISHYSLYAYENELRQGFGRKSNYGKRKGEKYTIHIIIKYQGFA